MSFLISTLALELPIIENEFNDTTKSYLEILKPGTRYILKSCENVQPLDVDRKTWKDKCYEL